MTQADPFPPRHELPAKQACDSFEPAGAASDSGLLADRLVREGTWLFRWRSYLPVVLLAPLAIAFDNFHYLRGSHEAQHLWGMLCLAISLAGLLIRAMTVGFTPAGTSGRNTRQQRARVLNTSGLYSCTRNPLYLGNFLIWLGIVAFVHNGWLIAVYIFAFWLYYERIIAAEEAFLLDRFGVTYGEWALTTPIFLPRLIGWQFPELRFSLRTVLRREYTGLLGVSFAFFALDTASHVAVDHRLYVDRSWTLMAVVGALLFLILRTLKRSTHVLHVAGR